MGMVNDDNAVRVAEPTDDDHLDDLIQNRVDIGTQVRAGDLLIGDVLESGPPLRIEQSLVFEPVRNGLLGDRGAIKKLSQSISESRLAAGNIDSAPERSNVRFLHGAISYTSMLVKVNKRACVIAHKTPCTVIDMRTRLKTQIAVAAPKPKKSAKRRPKAPPLVGADGLTANQRFKSIIDRSGAQRGWQVHLVRRCNVMVGRNENADSPIVWQQSLSAYYTGVDDLGASESIAVIAEALGVRAMWLQYGKGPEKDNQDIPPAVIELAQKMIEAVKH